MTKTIGQALDQNIRELPVYGLLARRHGLRSGQLEKVQRSRLRRESRSTHHPGRSLCAEMQEIPGGTALIGKPLKHRVKDVALTVEKLAGEIFADQGPTPPRSACRGHAMRPG